MMCKIKKCSLSKKELLGMIDPEIFSTNEKLTSLIKLTQINDVPNSGEPFELNSSSSSLEIGDGIENDSDPAINMLAVTISCVMLMASDFHEISEKNLTWAERYLGCIKDGDGLHPPNIQGILNHILLLKAKKKSDSDFSVNQESSKSEMECQSDQILGSGEENSNAKSSVLYS